MFGRFGLGSNKAYFVAIFNFNLNNLFLKSMEFLKFKPCSVKKKNVILPQNISIISLLFISVPKLIETRKLVLSQKKGKHFVGEIIIYLFISKMHLFSFSFLLPIY